MNNKKQGTEKLKKKKQEGKVCGKEELCTLVIERKTQNFFDTRIYTLNMYNRLLRGSIEEQLFFAVFSLISRGGNASTFPLREATSYTAQRF